MEIVSVTYAFDKGGFENFLKLYFQLCFRNKRKFPGPGEINEKLINQKCNWHVYRFEYKGGRFRTKF